MDMKKNILKSICIIALTGTFISCNDFLDKQPLDELSSTTFWKTTKDADNALTAVYVRNWNIYQIMQSFVVLVEHH